METIETKRRFIELRAKGYSFDKIAKELGKAKQTLLDWSRELDQEKLPILLRNKYQSLEDAKDILGDVANISRLFIEFQAHLYKQRAA